jgi:hypothetical protein
MSKGLGGTPIYRTMTDTKAAWTSWQSLPSRDYSSHENTWDARNMKATLLRNPVTSIGWYMHAFSPVGMRNIWWVHECALVR